MMPSMTYAVGVLLGGTILGTMGSTLAFAQEAGGTQAQAGLTEGAQASSEIIVTAQRREQSIMDVPVAVTALPAAELERRQLTDVQSLVRVAPSLTASPNHYGPAELLIGIRGMRTGSSLVNVDPAVGVYINGLYVARTLGANVAFTDVAQVEVLRGPQGTLFGRNTIGGALTIETRKPTDEFEGSVRVGYGNYDHFTATGIVNVPLAGDKLGLRLVYDHQEHSGYLKSGIQPTVGGRNFSDQNQEYARATLRAMPSDNVEVTLYGDYFRLDQGSYGTVLSFFDPTAGSAATSVSQPNLLPASARTRFFDAFNNPVVDPKSRTTYSQFNPENRGKVYNLIGTISVDLGGVQFKSITGYRNLDFDLPQDIDGQPFSLVENYRYIVAGDEFTQEFQLSGSAFDDRLSWITGLYYFTETIDNTFVIAGAPPTPALTSAFDANGNFLPGATLSDNTMFMKNRSMSAFAQVTYEILPRLKLTAGARYVEDKREMAYLANNYNPTTGVVNSCANLTAGGLATIAGGCRFAVPSVKFDYLPWTVGLDFKPADDSLIYAKVSRGFRSGALQQCCGTALPYYDAVQPESLISYEIGGKFSLLDRRLIIAAAGYHMRYDDIQQAVPVVNPSNNAILFPTRNTGKASVWGAELEATAYIGDLRLGGSLSLIDPKFTSGPYEGTPFIDVRKTSWSVSASYPIETAAGRIELSGDYSWRSSTYFVTPVFTSGGLPFQDVFSPAQKRALQLDSYGLLNAKIGFKPAGMENLEISAWGKNLANEYYYASVFTGPSTAINFYNVARPGDPRTYGITAQFTF